MSKAEEFARLRHTHLLIKASWQACLLMCMVILYQVCDWEADDLMHLKEEYRDKCMTKAKVVNKAFKLKMSQAEEIAMMNNISAVAYEFFKKYLRQQYGWSREEIKAFAAYWQEFQEQYVNNEISVFELNDEIHAQTGVWAIRPEGAKDEPR